MYYYIYIKKKPKIYNEIHISRLTKQAKPVNRNKRRD